MTHAVAFAFSALPRSTFPLLPSLEVATLVGRYKQPATDVSPNSLAIHLRLERA